MRRTRSTSKTHFSLELHRKNRVRFYFCHVSARQWTQLYAFSPATPSTRNETPPHVARRPGWLVFRAFSGGSRTFRTTSLLLKIGPSLSIRCNQFLSTRHFKPFAGDESNLALPLDAHRNGELHPLDARRAGNIEHRILPRGKFPRLEHADFFS